MKNMHATESLRQYSKDLIKELYLKGYSIAEIQTIGDLLIKGGEEIIENPENTIGKISNGQLIID